MNDSHTVAIPVDFRLQVHEALKAWNADSAAGSVLADLRVVQFELAAGAGNLRQATNRVLQQALKALAASHERDAALLRMRFLDQLPAYIVASRLNAAEASVYRWQNQAIDRLADLVIRMENQVVNRRVAMLEERLDPATYHQLLGAEENTRTLIDALFSQSPPWLVAINGIGGIGKTSLADAVLRAAIRLRPEGEVAWVSASQQRFDFVGKVHGLNKPTMTVEALLDALVVQLMPGTPRFTAGEKAIAAVRARCAERPTIVVVDNLETTADGHTLLPVLRQLANPAKFLLTTRHSFYGEPGVFNLRVPELLLEDALSLVRLEARLANLPELGRADDADLYPIYQTVGGNPLALRLVVGQANLHSMSDILNDLTTARGAPVESLYGFIYQAAWDRLAESPRRTLLAMPLVTDRGANLVQVAQISGLSQDEVRTALAELVTLSLVDGRGTLTERRYTIHALTRTFLLEQVARWH